MKSRLVTRSIFAFLLFPLICFAATATVTSVAEYSVDDGAECETANITSVAQYSVDPKAFGNMCTPLGLYTVAPPSANEMVAFTSIVVTLEVKDPTTGQWGTYGGGPNPRPATAMGNAYSAPTYLNVPAGTYRCHARMDYTSTVGEVATPGAVTSTGDTHTFP